ncbi:CDP-glycerol glycerophosphotransferase family protein [Neobacillus mesonae]|uniref:CDP-glycerol glycerophosphotransferase family protein n=1 Tax=Neobacillus mesonae TaxID=1193713 RepID=UPI0020414C68|nr:CDP-glycerol glycerophosphotransferase family protein [Neobacillus mesonae]MCM3568224.1 CDP-glycerol glycerophosphotransferase family protein [Neobacillus mesonae]
MIKKLLAWAIIYLFNCFPIKKNKIFFFSYYGSQYGDSPKYITEYILKNYPEDRFDVVWAFNNIEEKAHLTDFRKVKIMTLRYFYELCTSKVIITNFRTTDLFVKRKGQYYIQTWHSSLRLKQIEKDSEKSLSPQYIQMAKKDSLKCDLLLSGCEYSTKIFKRSFWYDGEILECGTPANDILFKDELNIKDNIFKRLSIPKDYKIVLYAPTFRKSSDISVYNLEFQELLTSLSTRFGGKWMLLLRLHPHLTNLSNEFKNTKNFLNVTLYDDVQELMYISDVLITDYSSVMFSFLLTKKPCFLYMPDLPDYLKNDRKLYFDIEELPYSYARTNQELLENINGFNDKKYERDILNMLTKINSYDDGNASARLLNKIENELKI